MYSPHNYDDEVQQIPAVPQVGVGVEEQAVGYYLQECLHRENDEEQILHTLLRRHTKKTVPFICLRGYTERGTTQYERELELEKEFNRVKIIDGYLVVLGQTTNSFDRSSQ